MNYQYPQVTSGYRWNMEQRIINAIGPILDYSDDVSVDGAWYTVLHFSRALTAGEKTTVDGIMASNPGYPPTEAVNTVYQIKDIWETKGEFSTKIGNLPFNIYYNESVPGSGVFDRIQLHFKKALGSAEKNKVVDEQSKLMSLRAN